MFCQEGPERLAGVTTGEVVFDRTWERNGVLYKALSQAAADLLTSPGRAPLILRYGYHDSLVADERRVRRVSQHS